MSDPDSDARFDDSRVVRALREYETALRAGARPDRREWLARHADVADVLTECVDGLEMLRGMEPADPTPSPDYPSFDSTGEFVDPLLATPLGDFRLIREIGRGGMGVVYEAVQLSLGRRVALKVLPFAAALDGRHLQRFKNEAQAAAHLHHTNIVPVYAVGCERGVHFYAMQLIEGSSLAAILKDLRRAEPVARSAVLPSAGGDRIPSVSTQAAPSSRRKTGESAVNRASFSTLSAAMSTDRSGRRIDYYRSVATLGLQAAEALEYAHQMGVVHRDVKPGNLLLDTRGHLWIADFGLAQFSAATDLTAPGVAVGTLPYMSPEQQAGKGVVLDHRTDVYSLGATLYEMFSLRPAFEGTARHRLVNQIQFEDPAPLRSIDKSIPVELETIIMKAMSKAPTDRYPSAQALADDLRRFLGDQPIWAKRPTVREKTVKWFRRHRAVAWIGGVLLALTAIGSSIATGLVLRAHAEVERAYESERDRAGEAERNYEQAREVVDYFARFVAEDLADVPPNLATERRRALDKALGYYQQFLADGRNEADREKLIAAQSRIQALVAELHAAAGNERIVGLTRYVRFPEVQADLKLSDEQAENLDRIGSSLTPDGVWWGRYFQAAPAEKNRLLEEHARKIDVELRTVLDQKQMSRLVQIALQLRMPWSMIDPQITEMLSLDDAQVEELKRLAAPAKVRPPMPPRGRPDTSTIAEIDVRRLQIADAMLAALSPQQQMMWNGLVGAPIRLSESAGSLYFPSRSRH